MNSLCKPALVFLLGTALLSRGRAQQVVQRGALGMPAQVLDETGVWTTPLPVAGDADEDVYVPDVSSTPWLERNYPDYANKGVYTVSLFTQYKRPRACRQDLIRWGFTDAAHLDACVDIGYRVRQIQVDTLQRTVTVVSAAMIGQDGQQLTDGSPAQTGTRRWVDLDAVAMGAIGKTNQFVATQMGYYDRKMRSVRP